MLHHLKNKINQKEILLFHPRVNTLSIWVSIVDNGNELRISHTLTELSYEEEAKIFEFYGWY